jgi:type I restriction enzyme R subunit
VVRVAMNPRATQGELVAAIDPVRDRLVKQYAAAQAARIKAEAAGQDAEAQRNRDIMDALVLFKRDMGQYQRLYVFLSQIFNYENHEIEQRSIFYRLLTPLLDFGREREAIDLSKVQLSHYSLRNRGVQDVDLAKGSAAKLDPITSAGSGTMQEKEKARLAEIIQRVNELFEGDLTEDDMLIYVNRVLVGKLLESKRLQQQAASNERSQFLQSLDLITEVEDAVLAAREAHQKMSDQALNDPKVMRGLVDILMNFTQLYEALRERAKAG